MSVVQVATTQGFERRPLATPACVGAEGDDAKAAARHPLGSHVHIAKVSQPITLMKGQIVVKSTRTRRHRSILLLTRAHCLVSGTRGKRRERASQVDHVC